MSNRFVGGGMKIGEGLIWSDVEVVRLRNGGSLAILSIHESGCGGRLLARSVVGPEVVAHLRSLAGQVERALAQVNADAGEKTEAQP